MKSTVVRLVVAFIIAAMGVALAVYADADDAPGGILLGILLVIGATVFGARAAQRGG